MSNELSPSVLLVEDHALLASELGKFLKAYGYVVTIANNGRQAVRKLSKNSYDFLITDIVMPEMDGFQLLSWLEAQGCESKVVVTGLLEGSHQTGNVKNIILALKKPLDPDQLTLLVETLNRHSSKIRRFDDL